MWNEKYMMSGFSLPLQGLHAGLSKLNLSKINEHENSLIYRGFHSCCWFTVHFVRFCLSAFWALSVYHHPKLIFVGHDTKWRFHVMIIHSSSITVIRNVLNHKNILKTWKLKPHWKLFSTNIGKHWKMCYSSGIKVIWKQTPHEWLCCHICCG